MKIQLIDKKENKIICTADVSFGLDTLIVNECKGMDREQFENWLLDRASFRDSYEMDEIVLKKLNLYRKKYLFGRMSEACVLYAMLCNFEKEEDNFAVYPLHDELFSMFAFDSNYTNLYLWRACHVANA